MSKQKGLEIFWLNQAGSKAEVHINQYVRTGHADIQISDVSKKLFDRLVESLGLKVTKSGKYAWFEFARARDGSKVTVFCEDESQ